MSLKHTQTHTDPQTHQDVTVAHRLFCDTDAGMNYIKTKRYGRKCITRASEQWVTEVRGIIHREGNSGRKIYNSTEFLHHSIKSSNKKKKKAEDVARW